MSDASSGDLSPVTFYPRRDMMLGLYGLAMIAVLAGIILVMVPTILVPGRVSWLLIPAVVLLLAGIAMAGLGQLAMLGKRCIVRFDAARWVVRPILGRSQAGAWTDVESIGRRDDAPGELVIGLTDGTSLGLATRWLDAKPAELEDAVRARLDRANGYRTVEQALAENPDQPAQRDDPEQAGEQPEGEPEGQPGQRKRGADRRG